MAIRTAHDIDLDLPPELASGKILAGLRAGTYERNEADAAAARVRPGLRVLELGAGMGYVTTICARQAGAPNVTSVEANPAMLPVIRANLGRNGQAGVRLLHGAVVGGAEQRDPVLFRVGPAFVGSRIADASDAAETLVEVPALPIRQLLRRVRPQVVLMDLEGAEEHLFDSPWNSHLRFLIVEIHPPRYSNLVIKRIVDCMSETGLTYDPVTSRGRILGFRRVWTGD